MEDDDGSIVFVSSAFLPAAALLLLFHWKIGTNDAVPPGQKKMMHPAVVTKKSPTKLSHPFIFFLLFVFFHGVQIVVGLRNSSETDVRSSMFSHTTRKACCVVAATDVGQSRVLSAKPTNVTR